MLTLVTRVMPFRRLVLTRFSFHKAGSASARQAQWLHQQLNLLVLIVETQNKITDSHWMMRLSALLASLSVFFLPPLFVLEAWKLKVATLSYSYCGFYPKRSRLLFFEQESVKKNKKDCKAQCDCTLARGKR